MDQTGVVFFFLAHCAYIVNAFEMLINKGPIISRCSDHLLHDTMEFVTKDKVFFIMNLSALV